MTEPVLNEGVGVSCEIILQKGTKVLMSKRGKVFGEGSWALPGGHLEKGETTEACAGRELNEEIGINPTKIKLLGIINDLPNIPGQPRQYLRFIFLIEDFSGEITNMEPDKCAGLEWFELNSLPEPIFIGHQKVIKYLLNENRSFFIEE